MRLLVCAFVFCSFYLDAWGQSSQTPKRWNTVFELSGMPSYSHRIISHYNPDERAGFSESGLADSFKSADRSLQSLNLFATYQNRKKKYSGTTVGLGMVTTGLDRVKTGNMFGYEIHPSLDVYDNQVVAGEMEVHYEFRTTYLTAMLAWDKRLDGSNFQIKQGSVWMQMGVMPSLQMKHELKINTVGFLLPEGNGIRLGDVYGTTVDTGLVINKASAASGNVFFTISGRLEYELSLGMHIAFSPRIMVPVLSNAKGAQTYWSPLLGLQVGLCIPIEN